MSRTETIRFTLTGLVPLLLHNAQTADPLNPHAKAMKEISSLRKKSDEDHEKLADLEFVAGLYLTKDGKVCIPGENVEAALLKGAKAFKDGPKCKAGVFCHGDFALEYKGPKTVEELVADDRFRDRRMVVVQRNRVMRTRPYFEEWSVTVDVTYMPDIVNVADIVRWMETAGATVGIGDYRPKFGRFDVEVAA